MPWILLVVALAAFYGAFVAHSVLLMVLGFVVGLGALAGWAWLRYRALFPSVETVLDETPLSADDVRRMRERMAAPLQSPALVPTGPSLDALRAAGNRVADREAERGRISELEREMAAMRQRIVELQETPAQVAASVAEPSVVAPRAPDEAWNPYALAPPKPVKVPPAPVPGMYVPMITPLRSDDSDAETLGHDHP